MKTGFPSGATELLQEVHVKGVDFSAGCIAGEEARVVRRIVAPCSEARKERANAFQTEKILGMRIADLHSSNLQFRGAAGLSRRQENICLWFARPWRARPLRLAVETIRSLPWGLSATFVSFSRDRSRWVAYTSLPSRALWRSRVDGSERLQLASGPNPEVLPRWSPDGKQIAYMSAEPGKPRSIFLIRQMGDRQSPCAQTAFQDGIPPGPLTGLSLRLEPEYRGANGFIESAPEHRAPAHFFSESTLPIER